MSRFRRSVGFAFSLIALPMTTAASADPHSTPIQITAVRVYSTGNSSTDFVQISISAAATVCSPATYFSFSIGTSAGQGMLANAITALSTGQRVTLEVSNATGCTIQNNAGAALQSLTLLAPGFPGPW